MVQFSRSERVLVEIDAGVSVDLKVDVPAQVRHITAGRPPGRRCPAQKTPASPPRPAAPPAGVAQRKKLLVRPRPRPPCGCGPDLLHGIGIDGGPSVAPLPAHV